MSTPVQIPVTCPRCSNEQPFDAWQSINVTLDSQLKTRLLDGSLNRFTCKRCGTNAEVVYPLLYHDMDKKLLVWLLPDAEQEPAPPPDGLPPVEMLGQSGLGYVMRRVGSRNELVEKIFIADNGLDDRAVECVKLILMTQLPEEQKKPGVRLLFTSLSAEQGQASLEFTALAENEPPQGLGVPREPIYRGCFESFVADHPQPAGWAVVDEAFAAGVIGDASGTADG